MIQRIQSLYLLLIAGLSILFIFLPLLHLGFPGEEIILTNYNIIKETFVGNLNVSFIFGPRLLLILIAIIAFITIFLFKNRKMQITLSYINLVLITFYCIVMVYTMSMLINDLPLLPRLYQPSLVIPIVNIILYLLTIRAIRKDEKLVRSLDRLR